MMVCNQISPSCTNLGWGLTDKGVVTVSLDQIDVYCDQGCYAHTMAVRKCINDVKRDFWFATRAHVQYVSDTISKGCSARKAFTTANYKASSGIKVYQKAYVSVISSLVVLVAIFNL
uniref:DUF7731 domain-containing protein n=1 Tax=Quercus lobata TaxID=97700 RepID=A0A7N2KNG0_QUELO